MLIISSCAVQTVAERGDKQGEEIFSRVTSRLPENEMMELQNKHHSIQELPMDSQATLQYLALFWSEYQGQSKAEKSKIVDNVARTLGIVRDSASRLLRSRYLPRSRWGRCSPKKRRYSAECRKPLEELWVGSGYMSSRHLKAAIPTWLPSLPMPISEEIRDQLLQMSERTIEGFLKDKKAQMRRKLNTGTRRGVRRLLTEIPIKPLGSRPEEPGHVEADLVAHCGGSLSGMFAWTLTVTDLATGWTECHAIWGKCGKAVCLALLDIERRLPFPIQSISFDNGGEFLNDDVLQDFVRRPLRGRVITAYRSRPYKKDDQCYVEQKNGDHVREYMGYGRLDWESSVRMMNNLYCGKWRILQNHFRPQQKLMSKQRVLSKVFRKMDPPETPLSRLQWHTSTDVFEELVKESAKHNPFELMAHVRRGIRNIYAYYKGRHMTDALWGRKVAT